MTKSVLNDTFYVFGGYIKSRCTNELWAYNTERGFWKKFSFENGPRSRANHSAVMWENTSTNSEMLVIVGGVNDSLERFNDVWLYSIKENFWTEVKFDTEELSFTPRSEHSAVIRGDTIIIFGGRDKDMKELNDVMVLNLESSKWNVGSGLCLKPTLDKSYSVNFKDSSKLISLTKITDEGFGSLANAEMQKTASPVAHNYSPQMSPQRNRELRSPSPKSSKNRNKISPPKLKAVDIENALEELKIMTPTTSSMLHSVVVHVGEKSLEPYMQVMKRRKKHNTMHTDENDLIARGRVPCARSGHSADLYGNYMIVFGGDRAQVALNDIYVYELK